jgi:hypothetical protein
MRMRLWPAIRAPRTVRTAPNTYGIHNQQWGGQVYICTGPRLPWPRIWPLLRHYD